MKKETTWWYFGITHLKEVQMPYIHHCRHALRYGIKLLWLGITSIIHGFIPTVFKFHSARGVIDIYNNISDLNHMKRIIQQQNEKRINDTSNKRQNI